MSNDSDNNPFGEVISSYTRAEALADGNLVDVTETSTEAGFRVPVALTRSVWTDCVEWTEEDNKRLGEVQDQAGRLWDVVWMAHVAAKHAARKNRPYADFLIERVPRFKSLGRKVHLMVDIGPGDSGEPVITIMSPSDR